MNVDVDLSIEIAPVAIQLVEHIVTVLAHWPTSGETRVKVQCGEQIVREYTIVTETTHWTANAVEACARAAHEANRAYCLALGDTSQPAWDDAPEWQRSSALNGVRGVLVDGNGPRQSHESWLREKEAAGWKYGPIKDPAKKEHPCFVPYDELPSEQKAKDAIFVTVVTGMAAALGVEG